MMSSSWDRRTPRPSSIEWQESSRSLPPLGYRIGPTSEGKCVRNNGPHGGNDVTQLSSKSQSCVKGAKVGQSWYQNKVRDVPKNGRESHRICIPWPSILIVQGCNRGLESPWTPRLTCKRSRESCRDKREQYMPEPSATIIKGRLSGESGFLWIHVPHNLAILMCNMKEHKAEWGATIAWDGDTQDISAKNIQSVGS